MSSGFAASSRRVERGHSLNSLGPEVNPLVFEGTEHLIG